MKGTLWGGPAAPDATLDAYTVGEDRVWDRLLLTWDILGTLGHLEALGPAKLIDAVEKRRLVAALRRALRAAERGELTVTDDDEDAHSALEKHLTAELGPLGEKVHTGRSRNDQVQVDLRLYLKDRVLAIEGGVLDAAEALADFAETHRRVVWPGYTHQRRAMPSSVGLWAAGFAEALLDDLVPLDAALALVDRSPLGSAAGYGVPLPLDRARVARALGFAGVQNNVTAVQASRGKLEVTVLCALWTVGYDLGKLAWDVTLFSSEEFGFLRLPPELSTGSSIMPHKSNPDVFELTRGRAALLDGYCGQAMALAGKLPSGYHRDLQLLKGPLMRGVQTVHEMVSICAHAVPRLAVDREACARAVSGEALATDEVFRRVRGGETFRGAYRAVAREVRSGRGVPGLSPEKLLAARRTPGGAGKLGLPSLRRAIGARRGRLEKRQRSFAAAMARLAGRRGPREK